MPMTLRSKIKLAIVALEDAKRETPWRLLFRGWQHTWGCDCRICKALFELRDLQKRAVEVRVQSGSEPEKK